MKRTNPYDCKHKYIINKDHRAECKTCGLLRSTIENVSPLGGLEIAHEQGLPMENIPRPHECRAGITCKEEIEKIILEDNEPKWEKEHLIAERDKEFLETKTEIRKKVMEFIADELKICRTEKTTRTPAQFANSRITSLGNKILELLK